MSAVLLAKASDVDISAHADLATSLCLTVVAALAVFFVVRPELWKRMVLHRVDPRPAALFRIALGLTVLWTFLDLLAPKPPLEHSVAHFLFTDEGLYSTARSRQLHGGELGRMWSPEHGFCDWKGAFSLLWGGFSVLHMRNDPAFVWGLYTAMCVAMVFMIFGFHTRTSTIVAWLLTDTFYRSNPIFFTGGDNVVRCSFFLAMFLRWGEAYGVDSWRRRRAAILRGASCIPPLRSIPVWPMVLVMLQLTIIYCATGLLKDGGTWRTGTALYYALNLDHFYRVPASRFVTIGHWIGLLPVSTIAVRWWELLFPIGLIGTMINAYAREWKMGSWPRAGVARRLVSYAVALAAWGALTGLAVLAARYYWPGYWPRWSISLRMGLVGGVMGASLPIAAGLYVTLRRFAPKVFAWPHRWLWSKRVWLGVGFAMHVGIDVSMNVGTFAQVMVATYFVWLRGDELDAFWRYVVSRPVKPGEHARPVRKGFMRMFTAVDRLRFRQPPVPTVVRFALNEHGVRQAALLRLWDFSDRLRFEPAATPNGAPSVTVDGQSRSFAGEMLRVLPGLWLVRPLALAPRLADGVVQRLFRV